ncbi:hypothetical protein F8388_015643 [Cannabis sativa]|uniref:Metal-nicotianamine transporter YSL7 n=1 Tax=Cannabis sativa TaxID=3483 RepID=A0A7J6I731_CANSA|nr:hypothetical protein F8388_015643 [Cannabis sativa]KAF4402975.1 hypothetical protein G4B88_010427 [Cannabis sativa]
MERNRGESSSRRARFEEEESEERNNNSNEFDDQRENNVLSSVEEAFTNTEVPSWNNQITYRAMATAFILSVLFNFVVCKLNLTTGVIPSLNITAGLLGFVVVKAYTTLLQKFRLLKQPFTRQENTVIQTCVVASSGIAFSSGTASYLLAMSKSIAAQGDEGNSTPNNVKNLSLGWMIGFLFVVSFIGLFSIVPLRKVMIMKYKLTYPSGTATAYLINSFHTPKGAKLAKKQVWVLFKLFGCSFASAFFQWFFSAGDGCGFSNFPTFGLQAYAQRFYFDFSLTYVGVGLICPYMVNASLLIGAIISWGIILTKQYQHSKKKEDEDHHHHQQVDGEITNLSPENYDEQRRNEYFLRDEIPTWQAFLGYDILAFISILAVPLIFPQLKWYHVLMAYIIAPLLAFCNAYACGLTDWSLASNYGKLAIIVFSAWIGLENGGVVAGLASCGVMMSIVSTASDLMQDFKTGYLTLASPRSMFFSQALGTAMGCIISPLIFWFFYKAYDIGQPGSSYPAPYGVMYRGIALIGVEGISSFPKHCLELCIGFFFLAIAINAIRELLQRFETKYGAYRVVPSPMCMAIPFFLGGYFAIDMCLGSLIVFVWRRLNKRKAENFAPSVAAGLICGESLWGLPAAILALAGIKPPICMKFLSASVNSKVDAFLG